MPERVPIYDPRAVDRTYRAHRARRRAAMERKRARRRAHVRFFAMILLLLGLVVYVSLVAWREVERLFGL